MKQGEYNGQFSHSLVYCVDTMDAVPRYGHKEQLTLNSVGSGFDSLVRHIDDNFYDTILVQSPMQKGM